MNNSGIYPHEFKVLIMLDEIQEVTDGGIILYKEYKDRMQMAETKGVLVAVGGNAFDEWNGGVPKVGNRVVISKYAGIEVLGKDEKKYRLCNDKDICGSIDF